MKINRQKRGILVAIGLIAGVILLAGTMVSFAQMPKNLGKSPMTRIVLLHYDGYVVSNNGKAVANVTVTLERAGHTYTTTTDAHGVFHFTNLRPGEYTVALHDPAHPDLIQFGPTVKVINLFKMWEPPR